MTRKRMLAMAMLVALSACGRDLSAPIPASETACAAGVAQLWVMDSMAKRLCGCQVETNGETVVPPATLDCTVAAGTRVFFRFESTFAPHQIQFFSPGQEGFSGHFVSPTDWISQRPHIALFTASGTYPFRDANNSVIQGSIIVP